MDIIGHFNPSSTPPSFEINKKKFEEWAGKGAIVSEAVKKLIEGNYEYTKYKPGKAEKKPEAPKETEAPSTEPADEPTA